jgi:hypothetical protein
MLSEDSVRQRLVLAGCREDGDPLVVCSVDSRRELGVETSGLVLTMAATTSPAVWRSMLNRRCKRTNVSYIGTLHELTTRPFRAQRTAP